MRHSTQVIPMFAPEADDPPAPGPSPPDEGDVRVLLDSIQERMVDSFDREWDAGADSTLLESATGTGKTVVAIKAIKRFRTRNPGRKALFVVDSKEQVRQARKRFTDWGLKVVVEQGAHKARRSVLDFAGADVVIGSRQSLYGDRLRAEYNDPDLIGLVIFDECHIGIAGRQIVGIREHFPRAKYLMLSATPWLEKGDDIVPKHCQTRAFYYPLDDYPDGENGAISNGHVVPIYPIEGQATVDLRSIKTGNTSHGRDYNTGELTARVSAAMEQLVNAAVEQMRAHGATRTICFLPNVVSAQQAALAFRSLGLAAEAVWGQHPDPTGVFDSFREGRLEMLCACEMASKALDVAEVDCLVMMRPTKSKSLFWQMIGRGVRLCDRTGKKRCLVIGFAWECAKDGPVSTLDMFSENMSERAKKKFRRAMKRARGPVDVHAAAKKARDEAEKEEAKEEEQRRRREIPGLLVNRRQSGVEFVPVQPFRSNTRDRRKALGLEVLAAASSGRLQIDQVTAMRMVKLGHPDPASLTETEANEWIEKWADRPESGMSTFGQVECLRRLDFAVEEAWRLTSKEAGRRIHQLRKMLGFA